MNNNTLFPDDEFNTEMFEDQKEIARMKLEEKKSKREKKIYSKLISALSVVLFVGILSFFFFLSLIDEEQYVSVSEKRILAVKPAFSFSELFKGKWTENFENYYSDNFPLRESFISASKKIETVLTRFSTNEDDSVIVKVEKSGEDFGGEALVTSNETMSAAETSTEKETTTAGVTLAQNDKNIADDKSATIKSSILIANKRAMELFSYGDSTLRNYSGLINNIADAIGNNANVYSMVVPTSIEFYGTKQYRTGSHSQRDAITKLYNMMNSNVKTVDAYSVLAKNTDKYLYFRTDHHWTQRGAYCAYTAFCNLKGITPRTLESYEKQGVIPGDFLGTLYNQTKAEVLKNNPDFVEYFSPEGVEGKIYQTVDMTNPMSFYIVARSVNSTNKYLAFIAGDQPLEKITTQNKNGKKIIVLKESFGNAFVPFLCNDYEEIYVLDPRKLTFDLNDFVVKHEIDDVMLINYAFGMSNPTYTKALGKMVK